MKKTIYHLRPANTAAIPLCNTSKGAPPDRCINSFADLPEDGRICHTCVRKLYKLPMFQPVPPSFLTPEHYRREARDDG